MRLTTKVEWHAKRPRPIQLGRGLVEHNSVDRGLLPFAPDTLDALGTVQVVVAARPAEGSVAAGEVSAPGAHQHASIIRTGHPSLSTVIKLKNLDPRACDLDLIRATVSPVSR